VWWVRKGRDLAEGRGVEVVVVIVGEDEEIERGEGGDGRRRSWMSDTKI
jgi:hypothetical protein